MATSHSLDTITIDPQISYTLGPTPTTTTVGIGYNTFSQVIYAYPTERITLLKNCRNEVLVGETLKANPDISGLGIILAFTISAYVVVIWAVFAYYFGLIPPDLLRAADRKCFRANGRRVNSDWRRALENAVITFSDQHIITGISILIAAYANLFPSSSGQILSVYHWQIATYLAWMSSNVHLTTLTLLRDYLHRNRTLLVARIIGMVILLVLLLMALVPTISHDWVWAMMNIPPIYELQAEYGFEVPNNGFGIPAHCFWGHLYGGINQDVPFSLALLIGSYAWKICQLNERSSRAARRVLRSTPEWALEKLALRCCGDNDRMSLRNRVYFRLVTLAYVPFVALFEFLESFLASLWLLSLGLIWGTLEVVIPRDLAGKFVNSQEANWNFGQILPLLLLLQPTAAIVEQFFSNKDETVSKSTHTSSQEIDGLDADSAAEGHKTAEHHGSASIHRTISGGDSEDGSGFAPRTLSETFRAHGVRSPSIKANYKDLEPQIEFLYSVGFFRATMWMIQLFLLAGACLAFTMSSLSKTAMYTVISWRQMNIIYFMSGLAGGIMTVLTGIFWGTFLMILWVFIGSFYSRAFM